MKIKITCRPQQSMWLKKNISKALAFGLLLNNIYFNSNANNVEIPNRYKTLEEEYITIDDSTEGELHEIEIFGNTVQDENNLEDIQSVGDLYVDEDENPILDSQGREQYKIDIIAGKTNNLYKISSANSNDLDVKGYKRFRLNSCNGVWATALMFIDEPMPIKEYTLNVKIIDYSLDVNGLPQANGSLAQWITSWNLGTFGIKPELKKGVVQSFKFTPRMESAGNLFGFQFGIDCEEGDFIEFEMWLDENVLENKTTILLPTQLQKVGNVADRLYWDSEKGRYVIEKNVGQHIFTGNEKISIIGGWTTYKSEGFDIDIPSIKLKYNETGEAGYNYRVLVNGFKSKLHGDISGDDDGNYWAGFSLDNSGQTQSIRLRIPNMYSTEQCREYIQGRKLIYHMESPLLIETNITSKLKIPTYEGKTYIYAETENGINPILKVTVDRLSQVAKNAIEEAKINPTTENISLARMYTNMLPESTYKDQLQEQLNEVFNSEITLDKKTASSNMDIYIHTENSISLSLDTNSVTFDGYSGVEPIEKLRAVNMTINSSLPYSLNAYMPTEIANSDKSETILIEVLNIRENTETEYQTFVSNTDKIVLKGDCASGNDITHTIDLKLDSNDAYAADTYKTVIRFEAEQK